MSGQNGTNLSPEDRCLLILARNRLAPDLREQALDGMTQAISWPLIVEQARAHGVLPLVTRNLGELGWSGVPAAIRTDLDAAAAMNAARNALFVRAVARVLRRFGEVGLPVIPLKGVALAESLYGDVTLRACTDIDILVPRHAVSQAACLLRADRWEPTDAEIGPAGAELRLDSDIASTFVSRTYAVPLFLELHWDIVWRWRRDRVAVDDLWAEAGRQTLWGVEAYALSREWEILYLAVHAAHHRWGALKWLVDVHEACAAGPVDWDRLWQKARRFGWGRVLALTLNACHALLDTPVPVEVARGPLPRWLVVFPPSPGPHGLWDEALFATRLFDGWPAKLRYLGRLVFVPTIRERQLFPLPSFLGLLYYPVRPLRLAARWASRWLGVNPKPTVVGHQG